MSNKIIWQEGSAFNPFFGDIYSSCSGAYEQAKDVFLTGCHLPKAWQKKTYWSILETGFGLAGNFLGMCELWLRDSNRPQRVHFMSVEGYPVSSLDLEKSCAAWVQHYADKNEYLQQQGQWSETNLQIIQQVIYELVTQYKEFLDNCQPLSLAKVEFKHFSFFKGCVVLTLCLGDIQDALKQIDAKFDSVFLDGFTPRVNPDMWELAILKSVANLCKRGTRVSSWCVASQVRANLQTAGFEVHKLTGLAPKKHRLEAIYDPKWKIKTSRQSIDKYRKLRACSKFDLPLPIKCTDGKDNVAKKQPRALIIGAGIAGACVAYALAKRSWRVTVLDSHDFPCAQASGLPVGLLTPKLSKDGNILHQLTTLGVQYTLQLLNALGSTNQNNRYWYDQGVLEKKIEGEGSFHWHQHAGWVVPSQMVAALLKHPLITFKGNSKVLNLIPSHPDKDDCVFEREVAVHLQNGETMNADWIVLCASYQTMELLACAQIETDATKWQTIAGLLVGGQHSRTVCREKELNGHEMTQKIPVGEYNSLHPMQPWPSHPINGHGHLIPYFWDARVDNAASWLVGATFEKNSMIVLDTAQSQQSCYEKLEKLAPDLVKVVRRECETEARTWNWSGIRCSYADRLPVVGAVAPGIALCTAFGARALSMAPLCAETLAAELSGESALLPKQLTHRIAASRILNV